VSEQGVHSFFFLLQTLLIDTVSRLGGGVRQRFALTAMSLSGRSLWTACWWLRAQLFTTVTQAKADTPRNIMHTHIINSMIDSTQRN
jgi:hypothetical protein